VDIEGLKAAAKAAKVAYKSDKTIQNKQKFKEAKEAVTAAERALGLQAASTPAVAPSTPAAPAPPPATPTEDILAGLKKKTKAEAGAGWERPNGVKADPEHPKCNRIFVGNLSYDIDDDGIREFFKDCGKLTSIQWIMDKTTERFKGCGVLDFATEAEAEKAVAKTNQDCLGRPIMVQYSKPRDAAAPANKKQSSFVDAPLAPKPEGCTTCFVGNLSFEIEDDDMRNFAEDCGEIKSIRWVNNKDTGDFKGCGFVEFHDPAAVDKFILKKGTVLKGRPIRIDYSAPRPPR
jgi:nucleolin